MKYRVLCIALVVSACTTPMTPAGMQVRFAKKEEVAGCTFLGQVTGTSTQAGVQRSQGYENATNDLLNNAGALGATHVVMTDNRGPRYWSFGQNVRGDAMRCGSPPK
ncbi:DUF4156 domain-containing protein [Reyranella sp. CPCC 100927]|uniref:DUF4156 domain-containing protein n=1 Tax=Reyranella sp. CPCC 100927 TaxID=2599616 RepID=UPI0011B43377|nr:DUF4156 domain-containing protein [Reyranella sp. CPCC 100927]TWT13686.1 DUF4156 domain-containing protein [Reyranella sp. CPCC 100927]